MTICKGKRYIKATCDKCVELPYCKPTEKPKFKELQRLLNGALLKRLTMLEEWKKAEVTVHDSFNERLNHLERALLPHHHSPIEYRVEKLENLVGTLQQHSEDIFALEKENTDVLKRMLVIEGKLSALETELDGFEIHRLNVLEANESVACQVSNKQAVEIHFIKERLSKLQDTVAELEPMGHIVVRSGIKEMKTGIPKKRSYTKREK